MSITGGKMSREITLVRFQGHPNPTELLTSITDEVKRNSEKLGGKWINSYFAQGQYDAVVECELPNPESSIVMWTATSQSLGGGFTTQTLQTVSYERIKNMSEQAAQLTKGSTKTQHA